MEKTMRLKPVSWQREIMMPSLALLVIAAIVYGLAGEITFQFIFALVFLAAALLHVLFLSRLKNPVYWIPVGFYLLAALTFFSFAIDDRFVTAVLAAVTTIYFLFFMWALFSRQLKWRHRDVLELAARRVETMENGYTSRPFPAGKIQNNHLDIESFAAFARTHAIAYPLYEKSRTILVIPYNLIPYLLGIKRNYQKDTYISIDDDREIVVHINKKDYALYQQKVSFDRLNAALADLFNDFLQLHRIGKEDQIMQQMDSLKFII